MQNVTSIKKELENEKVTQATQLIFAPQNKSKETRELEHLAKKIIDNYDNCKIKVENKTLLLTIDNKEYNLSELLEKADINHFQLDNNYLDKHLSLYKKKKYLQNDTDLEKKIRNQDKSKRFKDNHLAEIITIKNYTGSSYYFNQILRNDFYNDSENYNKEAFISTLILAQALRKAKKETITLTARGEGIWSDCNHKSQVESIKKGKNIFKTKGFSSTAKVIGNSANNFGGKRQILFSYPNAVDISEISCFKNENEVLLPPGLFQYKRALLHK